MRKWDPFSDLVSLQEDMQRLFGKALEAQMAAPPLRRGGWMPTLDIYETEEEIAIVVDLPGVKQEDLDLTVEEGVLTIRGERPHDAQHEEGNYHRIERPFGQFQRSVALPSQVDAEQIAATLKNGVLEVSVPRLASSKPRKIAVATSTEELDSDEAGGTGTPDGGGQ